jgi:hypothetical protein
MVNCGHEVNKLQGDFFVILGLISVLSLLGRCSTTQVTAPALFFGGGGEAFSYFLVRVLCFCLELAWTTILQTKHIWDHRHDPSCPGYLLRWGLPNFLPVLALNWEPPNLCLLSS